MSENFTPLAKCADVSEGQNKAFQIDGHNVLLCHTQEGFFAVENQCSHQLQALEGGRMRGCFIFCPAHGQRFNLKTGEPIGKLTDKPITIYPLKIDNGEILIRL